MNANSTLPEIVGHLQNAIKDLQLESPEVYGIHGSTVDVEFWHIHIAFKAFQARRIFFDQEKCSAERDTINGRNYWRWNYRWNEYVKINALQCIEDTETETLTPAEQFEKYR